MLNKCSKELDKKDVTDTNVGSIEEDIKILNKIVTTKFNNDYSIDNVDKDAIEHILQDYTRQKQINKELEAKLEFKEWGDLDDLKFEEYIEELLQKSEDK